MSIHRRTKIIATIGPASHDCQTIRQLFMAGMDVARLNFSHGSYDDHREVIRNLRAISTELDKPVTLLQDLQGPKIRVGNLEDGGVHLKAGDSVLLSPDLSVTGSSGVIPIDYPHLAGEALPGMQVLMDDGLLELVVERVEGSSIACRVIQGGLLKARKGVNFPNLKLSLPSLTEKDLRDLDFGLEQGVDWVSLSFVRTAADIRELKKHIADRGKIVPVIAKIEKPQALDHLEEIIGEAHGIMVARGDLGVEISPERVPLIQKQIIELCNRHGKPVITATQMLESMIRESRPTRAEASDVANAIIDGTDCIMLSGETAAGKFPVQAVEMMARIAVEVEARIEFKTYPPEGNLDIMALSVAANTIERLIRPTCIVVFTASGRSARFVAAERPKTPIYAITPNPQVFHALNLIWGIRPLLEAEISPSFSGLTELACRTLTGRGIAKPGDKVVILGGVPTGIPGGTNFIKIQTL